MPTKGTHWVLFKANVTNRVKVLPSDWRFQVAELNGQGWVNKVDTSGLGTEVGLCLLPHAGLGLCLCG